MNLPFITIIIPCRNEERYLVSCLESLIRNTYPKELTEIILVDGMSSDSTPQIIQSFIIKHDYIRFINNPDIIFPSAVNTGIRNSKGELIFIAGAHAVYSPDYIMKSVENSLKYDADNVGGILFTRELSETFVGRIVTFVLSSRFGVGNSTFRTGSADIVEADTVFGGCYRRTVFDKIGLLNENLVSTSDYEFNKRLRRNGGKIILDPAVTAEYYTRTTFKSFVKNNLRNGYWSIYPLLFVDYIPVSVRHFVPLVFILSLVSAFIFSILFHPLIYLFLAILILYFLFAFGFTIPSGLKLYGKCIAPFFFFILHSTYGLGSLWALIKIVLVRIGILKINIISMKKL